jgi:hypothetical protein
MLRLLPELVLMLALPLASRRSGWARPRHDRRVALEVATRRFMQLAEDIVVGRSGRTGVRRQRRRAMRDRTERRETRVVAEWCTARPIGVLTRRGGGGRGGGRLATEGPGDSSEKGSNEVESTGVAVSISIVAT